MTAGSPQFGQLKNNWTHQRIPQVGARIVTGQAHYHTFEVDFLAPRFVSHRLYIAIVNNARPVPVSFANAGSSLASRIFGLFLDQVFGGQFILKCWANSGDIVAFLDRFGARSYLKI